MSPFRADREHARERSAVAGWAERIRTVMCEFQPPALMFKSSDAVNAPPADPRAPAGASAAVSGPRYHGGGPIYPTAAASSAANVSIARISLLSRDEDTPRFGRVVAAISLVDIAAFDGAGGFVGNELHVAQGGRIGRTWMPFWASCRAQPCASTPRPLPRAPRRRGCPRPSSETAIQERPSPI
jgi:hypothetical protein